MSRLLEILGKAITVDTAELIWHWLDAVLMSPDGAGSEHNSRVNKAIELVGEMKLEAAAE